MIETDERQLQEQRLIIKDKDRQIRDKDRQIRDKDSQIREMTAQQDVCKQEQLQRVQQENQHLPKLIQI